MNVQTGTTWVDFTGEGEQAWAGDTVAKVNGVGVVYSLGCNDDGGDIILLAEFDGPQRKQMFGGWFTGPFGYVIALTRVLAEVASDME